MASLTVNWLLKRVVLLLLNWLGVDYTIVGDVTLPQSLVRPYFYPVGAVIYDHLHVQGFSYSGLQLLMQSLYGIGVSVNSSNLIVHTSVGYGDLNLGFNLGGDGLGGQ